eukprot:CAMPEP_0116871234 /NCGR_PEP_ID=MMETSP0463-20121206/1486_1 /TAXON_ID=181622 /ORGANISM="Strombidinopsis sp, Strain SopsisLIS2011" /LENGTH=126 /DNA_ID=CAMNT_0004509255 /DNA_START=862 /DNA_END=1242 /DNA_ORIENTATION=-
MSQESSIGSNRSFDIEKKLESDYTKSPKGNATPEKSEVKITNKKQDLEFRKTIVMKKNRDLAQDYTFDSFVPLFICIMQGSSALFTEIVCLVLIQGQRDVMDCIMNYIALGIIADIDNLYTQIHQD